MNRPHAFKPWALINRQRCKYCGLVWLRNEASNNAARASCKYWS